MTFSFLLSTFLTHLLEICKFVSFLYCNLLFCFWIHTPGYAIYGDQVLERSSAFSKPLWLSSSIPSMINTLLYFCGRMWLHMLITPGSHVLNYLKLCFSFHLPLSEAPSVLHIGPCLFVRNSSNMQPSSSIVSFVDMSAFKRDFSIFFSICASWF